MAAARRPDNSAMAKALNNLLRQFGTFISVSSSIDSCRRRRRRDSMR